LYEKNTIMQHTNYKTKILEEGITYDDVLLVPCYSEVLPRETILTTRLTKSLNINVPIISAAMDTITDSEMAIALAREGCIGVIHKNMSIVAQADAIDKVKRSESGMISKPITLSPFDTARDAELLMSKFKISGIPIIDENRKLLGIVTNRDLRFNIDSTIKLSEIMTKDNFITAPVGTTLEQAEEILKLHKIEKLPVVDEDNKIKGLITFKDIQKKKKYPEAAKDAQGRLLCGAAVGIAQNTTLRVDALIDAGADVIFIDTAHGHNKKVIDMVHKIKNKYPTTQIVAGNIATGDAAEELIKAGADAVKVGIGPGSICTTRIIAGVGVPQLTAIMNVAEITNKYDVPLIADGGIKQTGDIAKAIGAGADTVMIGNLLAGHEESPGEKIIFEGRVYKLYRGMGSLGAMSDGSADRYFQDVEAEISKYVPEGIEGRIPYKGKVSETIYQFVGGLHSAMGYCGCKTIAEMKQRTQFVRITNAGLKESHPHNISITSESPNYFV
jgi:IMP dehydrogenase